MEVVDEVLVGGENDKVVSVLGKEMESLHTPITNV
jgi:hypothetical protein